MHLAPWRVARIARGHCRAGAVWRPRVGPDLRHELADLGRLVPAEKPEARQHVAARRLYDEIALGLHRTIRGGQDQVLAAMAHVRADDAEIRDHALPVVEDHARDQPGGNLDDERAGFEEVDERGDVGRRIVRREDAEFLGEVEIVQHLPALAAVLGVVRAAPAVEADGGDRPQIGLAGALKVDLVVELRDGLARGIAALELQFTDACADGRVALKGIDRFVCHKRILFTGCCVSSETSPPFASTAMQFFLKYRNHGFSQCRPVPSRSNGGAATIGASPDRPFQGRNHR
jgi:hypothetical protein